MFYLQNYSLNYEWNNYHLKWCLKTPDDYVITVLIALSGLSQAGGAKDI